MNAISSPMVAAAKLPVLNPNEFELWKMRIEQYFLMTDYALWEVIVNGDSPPSKRSVDGVEQTYPPTTAEEKLARKNELKARGTLLMALPNEHQLKFNTYKCAKTLMEAIEKRFRGNKESKKTQKTLLKQHYENFNRSSSEGLDQTYDRLQKLISQLEILGETISQEDMNLKFLRSLPSEWKTHTLIWRNKPDLDTLSMDDLYNNLKIYETKVKGSDQAYGSNSANTDSMSDVVIYSFFANQSNSPQLNDEDLQQIDADDLEEMDLKWASRENRNREPVRRNVTVETTETKALVAQDGLGYDWSDQAEEGPTNFALMAYTSLGSSSSSSSDSESQLNVGAYKAGLESVEARLDVYKKNELRKKFEKAEKERDDLKLTLEKFENSSKNLSKLLDSQGNPQLELHDKGVIDSGCSRHMMVDLLPLERKSTTGDYETVIKEWEDILKRVATTASSLEAEQDSDTILGGAEAQIRFEAASKQSNDPPLSRVNTLGSGEDSMKLKELIELCTKMPERALDLA
ncbi:hypothetical protein Tco_1467868 [Tanacetum coccineum]